ncbi:MAG TPA: CAP domain-containing protein [Burkholderiaceae bacterium]|nr:CAP domain-containing protein [Burkholderiaceae bacterium]
MQSDLLQAINGARESGFRCGATSYPAVAALGWNDALAAAATTHSFDMALHGTLTHLGSDGTALPLRVAGSGYTFTALAENVAWNYASAAEVVDAWLQSPGHCANLMSASYREVGAACVRAANGTPYWTVVLGNH